MKVFVAGASGALGWRLVPVLVGAGQEVVGMTRSPQGTGVLREVGAEPVVADGLDKTAVMQAVTNAEPEVIIHASAGNLSAQPAFGGLRFDGEAERRGGLLRTEDGSARLDRDLRVETNR